MVEGERKTRRLWSTLARSAPYAVGTAELAATIEPSGDGCADLVLDARYQCRPRGPLGSLCWRTVGDRPAVAAGLTGEGVDRAVILGLALRLAFTLCGGAADVLRDSPLRMTKRAVVLSVGAVGGPMLGEMVERRLRELALFIGRQHRISVGDAQAKAS